MIPFGIESVIGLALAELLKVVLEARKKANEYQSILASMESTLTSITPDVERLAMLKGKLDGGDEETRKLWEFIKKGKEIVHKCSKSKSICDCFTKSDYMEDLRELNDTLTKFCQIEMPIRQRVTQIETFEEVKETGERVKEIGDKVENTHSDVKDVKGGMKEMQGNVEQINEKLDRLVPTDKIRTFLNGTAALRPCLPPDPLDSTFGLDKPLGDLKKKLLKEGMSVIVLSAPGGCGKTTLAKKLCHDKQVEDKFKENIFFVTVSKTPNLKVIVQQIFQHVQDEVPQFRSNEDAINRLEQLLKKIGEKQPILLVLDDVWEGSDSLIDSFSFKIPDYKILVTSRSTFPRFRYPYKMETLNEKDSMSLFRHSACLNDESPQNIDEDLVIQVVRACKGFPLALTVVGRSLCRQPEAIWKKRLREWSEHTSIFKDNAELFNCLKSSLDALDHKVKLKECYMDLGSFPEAQLIPATSLIDMWVELHEIDENGPEFIANLHELSNLNLIDLVFTRNDTSEADGYYNDHFVMQHDLLKELVNHLSSLDSTEKRKRLIVDLIGNQFPDWWSGNKQQPISANLFSVSTDETFSSNWCTMQAPEVKVLVLNFRTKNYALPEFITTMGNLKTLIVTNYGFSPAEISNFLLLGNLSKLKRIRLEQVLIPSLSFGATKLKNLKKIVLHKCSFGQDFDNTFTNVSVALKNLMEINISYCSCLVELPAGLCDILGLKKLSITYCHELSLLPNEIEKLVNLEVLRLSSCANLAMLPDTIRSLNGLSILDISGCVGIKKLPEKIGELHNLTKLYMTGCSRCEIPNSITKIVNLKNVICDEETAGLWGPLKGYFKNLSVKKVEP